MKCILQLPNNMYVRFQDAALRLTLFQSRAERWENRASVIADAARLEKELKIAPGSLAAVEVTA